MKSILLATDFSERSGFAVERAVSLAKTHGATLHLLHIIDSDLPSRIEDGQRRAAEAQLDELSNAMRQKGAQCMISLKRGEAHEAISEAALESAADLVVIGTHRRNPMRNAFVGTTAERMIRLGSTPVLIVRTEEPKDYRCVVVAVNLSEEEIGHIRRLQQLGLAGNDCLVPVFAYDAGQFQLMRRTGASLADLRAMFEKEKETVAPTVNELMREAGLDPHQALVKPVLFNTPDTILKAAAEAKADILVVGTRRKTAFKRYTLGSVSEACMLQAEVDLLVLPPQD
ncbi:MAG: universal stress protein [Pseudomonadota bacterium]